MKTIVSLVSIFVVSATLRADTVTVDGRGGSPNTFASISAALAALKRNDGAADVVQVTAAIVKEAKSVVVEFGDGKTDPLSIVGTAPDAAVVVFGDTVGSYAIQINATPTAQFSLKNLTLIPESKTDSESALVKSFSHGGVRIRMSDKAGKAGATPTTQPGVNLENVLVTSSLSG